MVELRFDTYSFVFVIFVSQLLRVHLFLVLERASCQMVKKKKYPPVQVFNQLTFCHIINTSQ